MNKHFLLSHDHKSGRTAKHIGLAAGAVLLPVWFSLPGRASKKQRSRFSGVNFAHRGLHTRDMSVPENSIKAFYDAASAGYGIELDVQLSKDGQVVVFHDDTLNRVCGVDARVNEKNYSELKTLSLRNTAETIPLFTDVLAVINGRVPLIVELKTAGKKNRELCEKTYEILSKYSGLYCIESFDFRIVLWFRMHHPEIIRGQLATEAKKYDLQSKTTGWLLSKNMFNTVARPHFMAYDVDAEFPLTCRLSKLLGMVMIGWTSHSAENEKTCDSVIFEFYRPETRFTH